VEGDRYRAARDLHRAATAYRRGLRLDPDSPQAVLNCSSLLLATRHVGAARRLLAAACEKHPDVTPLRANLLLTALYDPSLSPAQVARMHMDWGASAAGPSSPPHPSRQPTRLRIGYLSANFCSNPELFFSLPLLQNHDRSRFAIYLYSSTWRPDAHTEHFSSISDVFRPIASKSDAEVCRIIRRDGIHILVDLSGHFAEGRLGVLARKPAPIQVSFPTYPSTTGLATVNYRIGDGQTDPRNAVDSLYSEQLIRLRRCYCCYQPPDAPLGDLLVRTAAPVAFGIFNRPAKVTDPMLRVCARLLARVPGSRLLFHHTYNGSGSVSNSYRKPIRRIFQDAGIDPRRLLFIGGLPLAEHLQTIAGVDIALDTFPYNGMTTTCECYWMGVPVVTLAGAAHVSRVGISLASAMGLRDWIAETNEDYIDIAVAKACDLGGLRRLRSGLRQRMLNSSLTDARGYARAMERAYLNMWKVHLSVGRSGTL